MIKLLTGDFGAGKSTRLSEAIAADVREGRRACLLVPEQETVAREGHMASILPPTAPLTFEVSSFRRLANTVFRQVGGLSYRYADAGTRTLCMWRTMGELLPLLHEKGSRPELGRVRKMTAAMDELSALALTPTQLATAAKMLDEGSHLREKLEDLSLISTLYRRLLTDTYDDVQTDLDRLGDLLLTEKPLAGTVFYLDGFVSFTEQQYRVLRGLASQCDLTVALTLPEAREGAMCFGETRECARRLAELAREAGVPFVREDVGGPRRAARRAMNDLLLSLFHREEKKAQPTEDAGEALRFFSARDMYEEAAFVAADIARRVRDEGARYRDFAILCRSLDGYTGVIDTALETAGIPCFMSKKTDLGTYHAVKLIYTAYAVVCGGWQAGDVIAYLKCGMAGVSQEDADIFELYVSRWRLNGRRFTDETDWNMNPDGYTDRLTDRGRDILVRVNRVRHKLLDELLPLGESCAEGTVREHCRALWRLLTSLDVEGQLDARAQAAQDGGRAGEAADLARLWEVLLTALDRLVEVMGDTRVGGSEFVELLRLLLGETSLSRIPTSQDEVTVGAADMLRTAEPRHVYLIGVNDGVFPARVEAGGIFSAGDRRRLAALGLPVKPDLVSRTARELFVFARAFSAARESVTLLYAEATPGGATLLPSEAFRSLLSLSGKSCTPCATLPPDTLLYRRGVGAERLGLLAGTPEGEALRAYFEKQPDTAYLAARVGQPFAEENATLSPETAAALYGRGISLSPSRMSKYSACPFAFYCQSVLKLEDRRPIEFDAANVGSFVHAVLERLFPAIERAEGERLTRGDLDRIVAEIVANYIKSVCPYERLRTPRLLHLFSLLERNATLVAYEFYDELVLSRFAPAFFELPIGRGREDEPFAHALPYTLSDGTPIYLGGRVDRVDTYTDGDGKTYVRVLDYKTGSKSFSLDNLAAGLEVQLLVYLFSLWRGENPAFRAAVGAAGELRPAGAMYVGVTPKTDTLDAPKPPDEVEADATASLYRSGILLDDEAVLRAMDPAFRGRFLPVGQNAQGRVVGTSSLATLERMGGLVEELETVIVGIGEAMRAGRAPARPVAEKGKHLPCKYCEMRAVCRSAKAERE